MTAAGLLILRLAVGATVAAHGAQKLFGWFGGEGLAGTTKTVAGLGLRPARAHATILGAAEAAGGLLLAAGLINPLGVAAIVGVMAAAIGFVHLPRGFFAQRGGFEYPLILAVSAVTLGLTGPGAWSVDHLIGWNLAGWWGLAGVAAGIAAVGALALWQRLDRRDDQRRRRPLRVVHSGRRPAGRAA